MHLDTLYQWLQNTSLAQTIGQSDYLFPLIESLHVLSIALMMGTIALADLRLMGLINRDRPVSVVLKETLPFTIVAFVVSAITGTLMFIVHAAQYMQDGPFVAKLGLMVAAAVNIAVFHGATQRTMKQWDVGQVPVGAVIAGAVSLALWIAVLACGRWIGFTSIGSV
jgi:hypothetical protein